ncbi:MAG: hypothetical protein KF734_01730 [Saprospiraceae bacterium]|nr:hypothetical protein [Saprospiraceae bacterium]
MIVVSDTSPIINLAAVEHLELVPALFGRVIIPPAVFHEIVVQGAFPLQNLSPPKSPDIRYL